MAKILYLHGIGSGSKSRTSKLLQEALTEHEIIAPEIPIRPKEAYEFLTERFLDNDDIDLIVGSSMGGFYAMALTWSKRLLINPAMFADEDIVKAIGIGKQGFFCERENGEETYIIDEPFINELKEIREKIYNYGDVWYPDKLNVNELNSIYALFGTNDAVLNHYDDFCRMLLPEHAYRFEGEHRVSNDDILNVVVPKIREILTKPLPPICEVMDDFDD